MDLFKTLSPEEEIEFRQWARDNFDGNVESIKEIWHPVIQEECQLMIAEKKPVKLIVLDYSDSTTHVYNLPTKSIGKVEDFLSEHNHHLSNCSWMAGQNVNLIIH